MKKILNIPNKVLLSDIAMILKLFAPVDNTPVIFDPFGRLVEDIDLNEEINSISSSPVLINLGKRVVVYKGIDLDEFDLILDFGDSPLPKSFKSQTFRYINNRDGSLRWLYGKGKLKNVLSFYNTSTWRAKVISASLRLAHFLGIERIVSAGYFTVSTKELPFLEQHCQSVDYDSYSVFTGTAGSDRTAVIALEKGNNITHFVKHSFNERGNQLLENELDQLRYMKHLGLKRIVMPQVASCKAPSLIITSNVSTDTGKRSRRLQKVHYAALKEVFQKTRVFVKLVETDFWDKIVNRISDIRASRSMNQILLLKTQLGQLRDTIRPDEALTCSVAHGDFTPWNMTTSKDKIQLYDWELGQRIAPALYDLFHFHFQTCIISEGRTSKEILEQIQWSVKEEDISWIIDTHQVDVSVHLRLYILDIVSRSLLAFQSQKVLTIEQERQLAVWEETLNILISIPLEVSHRKVFIEEFHEELGKFNHAFLKLDVCSLEDLEDYSDLDIAVIKSDLPKMIRFARTHRLVQRVKIHTRSFMTHVELFMRDRGYVSIDLIHQFKRKGIEMMEMTPLLDSVQNNDYGVCVPSNKYDLEYAFLFYFLNGSYIPERYYDHFLPKNEGEDPITYLNKKYNLTIQGFADLFRTMDNQDISLERSIKRRDYNTLKNRISSTVNYLIDTVRNLIWNRGFVVTLSGVDGAGKSTIIDRVRAEIEIKYRKEVILMRHRPKVLPILSTIRYGSAEKAEKAASLTLPRQGKNNNMLSSVLRFAYYYLDYIIGQVYIYFKYILRGKVILFDRYYFDFIADAKRSNIQLSKTLVNLLYLFIHKPKLNILLWAEAQALYERKQELDLQTIGYLTNEYKHLFESHKKLYKNSRYRAIENIRIAGTVDSIMTEFSEVA